MHPNSALLCIAATGVAIVSVWPEAAVAASSHAGDAPFPHPLQGYEDGGLDMPGRLAHRIAADPFNLVGTVIFFLAIAHTFLTSRFTALSHRLERAHAERVATGAAPRNSVSHRARLFHFLGEVEVVFGLWAAALMVAIAAFHDGPTAVTYISETVNFTEAMFVVVIMTLAATRPILRLAEGLMNRAARALGGSLTAWWLSVLTLGPLLGSFITEPAAMTISALLLSRKFYALGPGVRFRYATLGLLFVNVSVGGTLTHFAAPPVLMVAEPWGWGMGHMLTEFGWKAALGIVLCNGLYWYAFRGELDALRDRFQLGAFKEQVLSSHLLREDIEREVDAAVAEIDARDGLREKVATLVEELATRVEQRLESRFHERIASEGIEPAIAREAFRQRFEEIRLYRLQREFPHLLSLDARAPFTDPNWDAREDPVPHWVTLVHVAFMAFTIVNAHHPELFVPGMLFFLGFATVTADYQNRIDLKPPLLVGFFLGGLVVHGGVQGWWIEPVLGSLSDLPLMFASTVLTAFNDNAAITYLSTLVPGFTDDLKYAVVAGAVTGGGLTVIANAPNPAGQSLLKQHFENGVSPAGLLAGALVPTIVMFVIFVVFR